MEEMKPVLKGRCSIEKPDFKGAPDQFGSSSTVVSKEVPESQRRDCLEPVKSKTTLSPALPHCMHGASTPRKPFSLPSTRQGGQGTASLEKSLDQKQTGARSSEIRAPLLSGKDGLGCQM